jgi:hypothetical protein
LRSHARSVAGGIVRKDDPKIARAADELRLSAS